MSRLKLNQRPKLAMIIQSDYPSFLAVFGVGLSWVVIILMGLVSFLIRPGGQITPPLMKLITISTLIGLLVTLAGTIIFFLRLLYFLNLFGRGIEAKGSIKQIQFSHNHGLVEFTYIFRGDSYLASQSIRKSSRTKALNPGDPVTLIVDEVNHSKVLLRDLYLPVH